MSILREILLDKLLFADVINDALSVAEHKGAMMKEVEKLMRRTENGMTVRSRADAA